MNALHRPSGGLNPMTLYAHYDQVVGNIEETLEFYQQSYSDAVIGLAKRMHARFIVPFCKKNGVRFLAGNGIFVFEKDGETLYQDLSLDSPAWGYKDNVSPEAPEGWAEILAICEIEIPMWPSTTLGALMPSYPLDD